MYYSHKLIKLLPPSKPVCCHLHCVLGMASDPYCPQKQSTALPGMDQNCNKGILWLKCFSLCAGLPQFLIWENRGQHTNTVGNLEQTECGRDAVTLETFSLYGQKCDFVSYSQWATYYIPKCVSSAANLCYMPMDRVQKLWIRRKWFTLLLIFQHQEGTT